MKIQILLHRNLSTTEKSRKLLRFLIFKENLEKLRKLRELLFNLGLEKTQGVFLSSL